MARIYLNSDALKWIEYFPENKTCEVEFRESGEEYRYFEVLEEIYQEVMNAESKGGTFTRVVVNGNYEYEKIT